MWLRLASSPLIVFTVSKIQEYQVFYFLAKSKIN